MYCVDKNQNFRNSTQVRQQDKPAVRGGALPGRGLLPRDLHFLESSRRADVNAAAYRLRSIRGQMAKIYAQNFGLNYGKLHVAYSDASTLWFKKTRQGSLGVPPVKGESVRDRCVPSCKISRRSVSPSPRYL